MVASLPRPFSRESAIAIIAFVAACGATPVPVAPGPPIPAEPDLAVGTMTEECAAFVASLETWKQCTNLDEAEREYVGAWIERANLDFAAGAKAKPDDKAQHAIAHNCRRGTSSVLAATERCHNGRTPKP